MKLATKAGQEAALEPNYSFDIAASDTNDVSLIGANIHCNKTGTYNVLLSGNATPVKLYLVAGIAYPYRIKRLYVTDTENTDGLVGVASVASEDDKA